MTIILRMQQLPWSATSMDIRRYFSGLNIPDGGVHIVGGENGDVFIAFSTDEDARQAMQTQTRPLCGNKITLMLSSKSEMQEVIARNRAVSQTKSDPFQEESPRQSPAPASQALITPRGDPLDKPGEYGDVPKGQTRRNNFDPKRPNQPLMPSEGSYLPGNPPQRPGEGKSLLGMHPYMNRPLNQIQGGKAPGYDSDPDSGFNGRRDQMYPPGRPGDVANRPLLDRPPGSDPGSQGPFGEDPFRNQEFQINMRFQGPSDMDSRVSANRRPPLLQLARKDGGPPYVELRGRDILPDEHPSKRFKSGPEQKDIQGHMPVHPGNKMFDKQNDRNRGFDKGSRWNKTLNELNQTPKGVEGSNMDDLRIGSSSMYGNANRFSQMDRGPRMGVEGGKYPDDPFGLNDPFDDARGSSVARDTKGDKDGFDPRRPGKQMESDDFERTGNWAQQRMAQDQRGPSLLDLERQGPGEYMSLGGSVSNEQGFSEPRGPRESMNTDQRRRLEYMGLREQKVGEDERRMVGLHMGPGGRMDEFGDPDGRGLMGPGRMGPVDHRGPGDQFGPIDRRGPGNMFRDQEDHFGRVEQKVPTDSAENFIQGDQMGSHDCFGPGDRTDSDSRFNPNDRFGSGERREQGDFFGPERQMIKDEGRHRGGGRFGPEGRFGHSDPQGLQELKDPPDYKIPEGMGRPVGGFDPRGRVGPRENEWGPRESGRPGFIGRDGHLQQDGFLASGGPARSRGFHEFSPGDRHPDSRTGPRGLLNDPSIPERPQREQPLRDERMMQKNDIVFREEMAPGGPRRRQSRFDQAELEIPEGPHHKDSDMRRGLRTRQEPHQEISKSPLLAQSDTSRHFEGKKKSSGYVRVSGMPYNVSTAEIYNFFDGLEIAENGIRLILDSSRNKPNGNAYIKFVTTDDATKALKLSMKYIGKRYIDLKPCRESDWDGCKSQSIPPPDYPPKAEKGHRSRSRSRSPIRSTCVEMRGLPQHTETHDIKTFFGCNLADDKIFIAHGGDNAYVEFPDQQSVEKAIRKNENYMGRHTIEVKLIFKEIMNARIVENKKRFQEKQAGSRSSSSSRDLSSSRDGSSRNAGSRASSSKDTSKDVKSSSSRDRSSSSRESTSRTSRDQDSRQSTRQGRDSQRGDDKDSKSRDRDSRQASRTKDQNKDAGSQQVDQQNRHGGGSPSLKKGSESRDEDSRRSGLKSGSADSKRQESHSSGNARPGPHKESPVHSYESRQQQREVASIRGPDPRGSDPRGSDPRGSDPRGSDPRGSDPRGSDPRGSDPRGSDPRGADPRGADPRGADPRGADPRGADPRGADPRGADPRGPEENPTFPDEKRPLNPNEKSCISMRNMPYDTSDDEIHKFFEDMKLQPLMVHFLINPDGRPNGQAYVEFQNSADAHEAVSHADAYIRDRRIVMSILARSTMMNNLAQGKPPHQSQPPQPPQHGQGLLGSPRPPLFPHPPGNRPPMEHRPPLIGNKPPPFGMRNNSSRMRGPRPPPIDVLISRRCVLEACNLPFDIPIPAIIDFFSNYNVVPESVRLKTNEQGRFSGEAMVALRSPEDASQALADLNNTILGGRVVRMHLMKHL